MSILQRYRFALEHRKRVSLNKAQQNSMRFSHSLNPTTIVVAQLDMQRLSLPPGIQAAVAKDKEAQPLITWLTSMRAAFTPLLDERVSIMLDVPFTASQVPCDL